MTYFFNKKSSKLLRQELRGNLTEEEKILWVQLCKNKTGVKWRRQHGIGKYIADFYCSERKLVIELDGTQHLENQEYDKARAHYMESLGITTLRFWNQDIRKNLNGVMMVIRAAIQ